MLAASRGRQMLQETKHEKNLAITRMHDMRMAESIHATKSESGQLTATQMHDIRTAESTHATKLHARLGSAQTKTDFNQLDDFDEKPTWRQVMDAGSSVNEVSGLEALDDLVTPKRNGEGADTRLRCAANAKSEPLLFEFDRSESLEGQLVSLAESIEEQGRVGRMTGEHLGNRLNSLEEQLAGQRCAMEDRFGELEQMMQRVEKMLIVAVAPAKDSGRMPD